MQENFKAVTNCEIPKCSACGFGKGNFITDKVKTTKKNPLKSQNLKKDPLIPGHMVSADHYILWATVSIYRTKGK